MTALPNPHIFQRATCRACGEDLQEILNLGSLCLNAFPQYRWEIEQLHKVPLIFCVCTGCGLAQLDRTVPPDWLYREYWYKSGVNEMMIQELEQIVSEAVSLVPVGGGETVVDIGANDGTLLAAYAKIGRHPYKVAIEPALNLANRLAPYADHVLHEYFPDPLLLDQYRGRVSIVTAIAMCYDLEDPQKFFEGIHTLLQPGGVAIVQFQDFAQQLQASAFDNICHEHLEYYTLWSLLHITNRCLLSIQSVKLTPINGGSLRVVLRRQEDPHSVDASVAMQLSYESQHGLSTPEIRNGNLGAFHLFAKRVQQAKAQTHATLHLTRLGSGTAVDVYGASTKGNILLQVLGLGPTEIRQAIDRSPEKHGRLTVTGIPIVGEEQAKADPAPVWLCPIWQFRESVLRREVWYLERGGTIIFPLPQCEIVREGW